MEVLRTLRGECQSLSGAVKALRRRGLREEALTLETPGLLDWAERRVRAEVALTAASPEYPPGWIRKLGASAPAALWKRGSLPNGPFLAIVGSRRVRFEYRLFAREVGAEAVRLGYAVVSGGAAGCDRAAAGGAIGAMHDLSDALPLVEILPCGTGMRKERFPGCVLSPFAPQEEFSGPNAMQRNALIYSMADAAVIVHARFGEGGTWRGAIEANRRRLCRLIVKEDLSDRAARALIGLGAYGLNCAGDLAGALISVGAQGELALEG
jgi:predicted Rossmann fold nucleotide-binding protein DprA/Smf involved in DNA uptake